MNPQELNNKIDELSNKLDEQSSLISEQGEKIEEIENKPISLDRYLDNQSKDIMKDVIDERENQYTSDLDYTTSTTTVHDLTFKPKMIYAHAYMIDPITVPSLFGFGSGVTEYRRPTKTSSHSVRISQDTTKTIVFGVGTFDNYLIKVPSIGTSVVVNNWGDSSITLGISVATNWTLALSIMVTG